MLLIQFDPISQSNTISTDPGMIPLVNQNKTGFTYSLFINDTCNLYLSSDDKNEVSARKAAVKNRRTMSDADLKKKIERLKLEREFKNLTEDDIAPGRKYVSEILSASGKKALTVAAAGAMTYAVKTAMTKEFNLKEAAQYIAANPNKKK